MAHHDDTVTAGAARDDDVHRGAVARATTAATETVNGIEPAVTAAGATAAQTPDTGRRAASGGTATAATAVGTADPGDAGHQSHTAVT